MKACVVLLIGTVFCFVFFAMSSTKNNTNESLILEQACTHLFSKDLGYALVGAKPMALEELGMRFFPGNHETISLALKKKFEKSNFIFRCENFSPWATHFCLINKKELRKAIKHNSYLMEFINNKHGGSSGFFKRLQDNSSSLFKDIFFYDDRALGIAFGYGQHNADYYMQLEYADDAKIRIKQTLFCLERHLSPFSYVVCKGFPLPKITEMLIEQPPFTMPNSRLKPTRDALDNLAYNFPLLDPPYLFEIPPFVAKKSQETQKILERYRKARDILAKQYCKKPFAQILQDIIDKSRSEMSPVTSDADVS
jgi:hypothetical protein